MEYYELSAILEELGWSKAELGRRAGIAVSTIYGWRKIPGPVAAYVRLALAVKRLGEKMEAEQ